MNFEEVKNLVEKALNRLLKKDKFLLENNLNERTISHKLAEYLQKEFSNLDVDCEYNRNFDRIKKICRKPTTSDNSDAVTVYPDIIVHHRNTEDNLLVIEIKKNASESDRNCDKEKINEYIDRLQYKYGLFIDLKTGTKSAGIKEKKWFPEEYNLLKFEKSQ